VAATLSPVEAALDWAFRWRYLSAMAPTFIALSMPGMGELLVILVIVMIFFGVGRLPAVLGEMGKGIKAFKDGMKEGDDPERPKEIDVTPRSPTTQAEEVREKG
jgi:sec-independent protein translocase protein TatA